MMTLTGCAATRDATERRAVIDQNRFRRVHAGEIAGRGVMDGRVRLLAGVRWMAGRDRWQGAIPDRGAIMGICVQRERRRGIRDEGQGVACGGIAYGDVTYGGVTYGGVTYGRVACQRGRTRRTLPARDA